MNNDKYFDMDKLIIPNGELIMKVNCKYCLPCGICELKSTFDKKIICTQHQAIELKLQNKEDKSKSCINCFSKEIPMKEFPCKECYEKSKWRPLNND